MRHYVTITGVGLRRRMYLRGGARMYTHRLADAAVFQTIEEATDAGRDLKKLLSLTGRKYTVGTMSRSGGNGP